MKVRKDALLGRHNSKVAIWYDFYLRSKQWMDFKDKIVRSRGDKCENGRCSRDHGVLHHKTYEHVTEERPSEVQLLCHPCHAMIHKGQSYKIPFIGRIYDETYRDYRDYI